MEAPNPPTGLGKKPVVKKPPAPRPSGFQTQAMWQKGPKRSGTYGAYLDWWKKHQAAVKAKTVTQPGSGGKPVTTVGKTPTVPGIGDIRSYDDLQKLATSQVDTEQTGQITPLETQIGSTTAREEAARRELEQMFGSIQPAITDALHVVDENFDKTRIAEQAIFSQAGQRLNELKQDSASQAQQLAQQIGGPVAVDKFTGNVDPSIAAFSAEAPNQQLHDIGIGRAGVDQMANFAGRVFPLIRVQKQLETRQGYEDKIKEIQGEIAKIKGQRQGSINTKLNDLITSERTFQLQKAQQRLDQLKTAHDWQTQLHAFKNDDARLHLLQDQYKTDTALKKGELAYRNKKLTADQAALATKLGWDKQKFFATLAQKEESIQIQRNKAKVQQTKNAMQIAKALMNPTSIKPITLTHKVWLPKQSEALAAVGKIKAFYDPKSQRWYQYAKETTTTYDWMKKNFPNGQGTRDATQMWKALKGMGVNPVLAARAVLATTGVDPRNPAKKPTTKPKPNPNKPLTPKGKASATSTAKGPLHP